MELNTADDQGIFDVYLGLAASGYDLANPHRAGAICEAVAAENWGRQTLQYFRFARINDGRVNPYWPRGSILAAASLLIDNAPATAHLAMIRAYLAALDNLSPAEADDATAIWATALPEQAASLRTAGAYSEARARYRHAIQAEIHENGLRYEREVLAAQRGLHALLPSLSSPQVTTVLNPLQADPLTDVVSVRDRVYVVTSHLRAESYVHELVHILLDPRLRAWEDRIARNVRLLDPVYDRMTRLTYAWDRSAASWNNVFAETLVRVLTAALGDGRPDRQASQIAALVQAGFAYALPIAETIAGAGREEPLSDQWLDRCLQACARAAGQYTKGRPK